MNNKTAKEILKQMYTLRSLDPMVPDYIRVKYTRYDDDFVVCIIGSKKSAEEIMDKIKELLNTRLKLELNMDKTIITNLATERARFLGFEILKTTNCTFTKKNTLITAIG
ncbi:reverse transcriptase domain-containing protein [Pseudobacteroides cellulosolvens]|uniref:reverse transcriptase domain-containing protein n=1 Tax=Pseudobacteroides cellulosolvens TaxID=35825 RepID=UPI00056D9B22|nr:reverse transcriptase domain-containing protein [Pseudobacteroides cellulosolvens]